MAKNLKINIKNTQIAKAINIGSLKEKLAENKKEAAEEKSRKEGKDKEQKKGGATTSSSTVPPTLEEPPPRIRARSKSAFAEGVEPKAKPTTEPAEIFQEEEVISEQEPHELEAPRMKSSQEIREEIFKEEASQEEVEKKEAPSEPPVVHERPKPIERPPMVSRQKTYREPLPNIPTRSTSMLPPRTDHPASQTKLGPTGKHIKDLLPPRPRHPQPGATARSPESPRHGSAPVPPVLPSHKTLPERLKEKERVRTDITETGVTEDAEGKKGAKGSKIKEYRDIKPTRREGAKTFDARDRHGLTQGEEEARAWRKKRTFKHKGVQEDTTIRPTSLKVRIPISIKDLANEMKLKSSQLVQKLFLQGMVVTLNDLLEDETVIQILGQEFGCEIAIDSSEEERIRITDKTVQEEIKASSPEQLKIRPPVVAFMGHVDHGKTSLIDAIRKSNRAASEAGAITQHIGAFRCSTPVGDIAILDTPGHEAFSAMRARGANVTDIVVLVIAGDEGMRQQTIEAMQHAKQAGVTIVVALNKSDKPNFNAENVYRQLAEHELLPEQWGGQTIVVNCSAITGEGIPQLLEMLALQAEVLELRASPSLRARGHVLESEMHKGMGAVATVLVQNGTLRLGDPLVFSESWCRVKTMRDEYGKEVTEAPPSTPVEITGLSGMPEAGEEFIAVKSEKEAREIGEARRQGQRIFALQQKKKLTAESMLQQGNTPVKKVLNILIRADVQGSLEALRTALQKIKSDKAEISIIYSGIGEVTESDVQLAAASKAVILGFHTAVEMHADQMVKQFGLEVRLHDIIYHAIDDVKGLMVGLLDKIAIETDKGKALVKALFRSSQLGVIAGCQVTEGIIQRNHQIRVKRGDEIIWKGGISSLKRVKEDVREVQKGLECGILLNGFTVFQEGDILESYEITYITQEL